MSRGHVAGEECHDGRSIKTKRTRVSFTDRNKKAARSVHSSEELVVTNTVWKQLQPRVITVEDYFATASLDLCEPGVLRSEGGAGIALGEIEDQI